MPLLWKSIPKSIHQLKDTSSDDGQLLSVVLDTKLFIKKDSVNVQTKGLPWVVQMDEEVADWGWYDLNEITTWLNEKPSDFCDETIQSLLRFTLQRLQTAVPYWNAQPSP